MLGVDRDLFAIQIDKWTSADEAFTAVQIADQLIVLRASMWNALGLLTLTSWLQELSSFAVASLLLNQLLLATYLHQPLFPLLHRMRILGALYVA